MTELITQITSITEQNSKIKQKTPRVCFPPNRQSHSYSYEIHSIYPQRHCTSALQPYGFNIFTRLFGKC